LLRWRRNELAPIHGHREAARFDIKPRTLKLKLPGVHLPAISLAPGFELRHIGWMTDDTWDSVAHGEDWSLNIIELLNVGLEQTDGEMSQTCEDHALDVSFPYGLGGGLAQIVSQLVIRKPSKCDLNTVLQWKCSLLDDSVPVTLAHEG
jgi:hypothetical protein